MDEVSVLDVTGAANTAESIQSKVVFCLMQCSFMEEKTEEMLKDK